MVFLSGNLQVWGPTVKCITDHGSLIYVAVLQEVKKGGGKSVFNNVCWKTYGDLCPGFVYALLQRVVTDGVVSRSHAPGLESLLETTSKSARLR